MLLDLPPKLRNLIWQFSVVSNDYIPIYTAFRVRKRTATEKAMRAQAHESRKHRRTTTEYLAVPPLPELVLASKQLRDEVMPVFFGENTFVVNCTTGKGGQLRIWNNSCRENYRGLIRRLILEFDVDKREYFENERQHGGIELRLDHACTVNIIFDDGLEQGCVRDIERLLHKVTRLLPAERRAGRLLTTFASRLEDGILRDYTSNDTWESDPRCEDCGKLCHRGWC